MALLAIVTSNAEKSSSFVGLRRWGVRLTKSVATHGWFNRAAQAAGVAGQVRAFPPQGGEFGLYCRAYFIHPKESRRLCQTVNSRKATLNIGLAVSASPRCWIGPIVTAVISIVS